MTIDDSDLIGQLTDSGMAAERTPSEPEPVPFRGNKTGDSRSPVAKIRSIGIHAALLSAVFLGLAPIFGKQAILMGLSPLAVVALRTCAASSLLLVVMIGFRRHYLYIYPVGLAGCLLAGGINGIGSLFYYSALGRIDAGVGHLIYSLYPIFVVFWMVLDRQHPSRLTYLRLIVAILAVYLLTQGAANPPDITGVLMMLAASALYALHLPINQRVLYDVPAPTVTLYTLIAMSAVVAPAYLIWGTPASGSGPQTWAPIVGLTLVTFFSRLTLFLGVKHIGGMQTALLGLGELLITILLANLWLGERLEPVQWLGALLLGGSLLLVTIDRKRLPVPVTEGWLHWLAPPRPPSEAPLQIQDRG